jgi:hypothetical protein
MYNFEAEWEAKLGQFSVTKPKSLTVKKKIEVKPPGWAP